MSWNRYDIFQGISPCSARIKYIATMENNYPCRLDIDFGFTRKETWDQQIMGIAVLSDFDGTLTPSNGLDILYKRFGAPSCKQVVERWDRGEISTMEELTTCFSTMAAHREEMEIPLMQITLDPAVPQLLKFCSDRNYEFGIVSDGLRWYIDLILEKK